MRITYPVPPPVAAALEGSWQLGTVVAAEDAAVFPAPENRVSVNSKPKKTTRAASSSSSSSSVDLPITPPLGTAAARVGPHAATGSHQHKVPARDRVGGAALVDDLHLHFLALGSPILPRKLEALAAVYGAVGNGKRVRQVVGHRVRAVVGAQVGVAGLFAAAAVGPLAGAEAQGIVGFVADADTTSSVGVLVTEDAFHSRG